MGLCPACSTINESGATKCKHCGREIPEAAAVQQQQPAPAVKPQRKGRGGFVGCLVALLLLGAGGYAVYHFFFAGITLHPFIDVTFAPRPDPNATAQTTVDARTTTRVALPDGTRLTIPAGSVKNGAIARVAKLLNSPPQVGTKGALSPVYDFSLLDDAQPEKPVVIEIPLSQTARSVPPSQICIQRWTGVDWRPVGSNVDLQTGKVTAAVSHLSEYQVGITTRYEPGPAQMILNPTLVEAGPRTGKVIPQGATVECIVYTFDDYFYKEVVSSRKDIQFLDEKGSFVKGRGAVAAAPTTMKLPTVPYNPRTNTPAHSIEQPAIENRFVVRVPVDAPLGKVTLEFIDKDGKSATAGAEFTVARHLVIILDIDGLRQDVFHAVLDGKVGHSENPEFQAANLRRLAGKLIERVDGGDLRPIHFEHGISLRDSVTIFPTVTAVGHAAIFTGRDPKDYGIVGNNWFDRDLKRAFGYMGYDVFDQLKITYRGAANERIHAEPWKATTVYEAAYDEVDRAESIVFENFYFGDEKKNAARFVGKTLVGGGLYIPCRTTHIADSWMALNAAKWIKARDFGVNKPRDSVFPQADWEDVLKLGIYTLYFAGLDHCGHEGMPSGVLHGGQSRILITRQINYLLEHVDTLLGEFFNSMSDVSYKNSTFVVIADHGQVAMVGDGSENDQVRSFLKRELDEYFGCRGKLEELLYAFGYLPKGTVKTTANPDRGEIDRMEILDDETTAQVGLNGGVAHIYLRRLKTNLYPGIREGPTTNMKYIKQEFTLSDRWELLPTREQSLNAAERFRSWSASGLNEGVMRGRNEPRLYRNSICMILVRNADSMRYEVFLGKNQTVPLADFLKQNPDVLRHFNWEPLDRNAALLADRIERANSRMSGDLILVPWYPTWYFDAKVLQGNHGGLCREEFEVPFAAFRPAADTEDLDHLRGLMRSSIDLTTKDRPAVTDLRKFVLEVLKKPVPDKAAREPDPLPGPWELKVIVDPNGFNGKLIDLGGWKGTPKIEANSIEWNLTFEEYKWKTKIVWDGPPSSLSPDQKFDWTFRMNVSGNPPPDYLYYEYKMPNATRASVDTSAIPGFSCEPGDMFRGTGFARDGPHTQKYIEQAKLGQRKFTIVYSFGMPTKPFLRTDDVTLTLYHHAGVLLAFEYRKKK